MTKIYTILLSVLMVLAVEQIQAQITGDTSVCSGESVTYTVPASPGASYSWTVSGGSIIGPLTADSVTISWGVPGTGTLVATVNLPNNSPLTYFLSVTVHPKPSPSIVHVPYPGCPPEGRDGAVGSPDQGGHELCEKVCDYATITYYTTLNAGSTYQWVATGAQSISGQTSNTVIVTWDATSLGSLTVYETNQWGCVDSAKICVEKMDLPVPQFSYPLNVCKGSTVNFTNLTAGTHSYQWYFGDGSGSTQTHPTHSYANGGTYTVTLIAVSKCFCTDTIQQIITVDSLPGPDISCPSTVCAFDTATYSTSSAGCTYNWFALGGTIIGSANQQSVTVAWGPGQLGQLGLVLSGCVGVCSDTTWITIPIVPAVAVISGPIKVCPGACEEYSLPHFSGAVYNWSLNSGSCGTIVDTSCHCEKIKICWPAYVFSCADTLYVNYYDEFLGCGGTATLIIRVRPTLSIYGQNQGCSNGTSNFYASGGIISNWSVSPAGPILSASPAPSLSVDWNGMTGTFVVSAGPLNPNQTCNDSAFLIVNVIAPPAAPVITGDTLICLNTASQYCATGSGNISWIITGGTPVNGSGNCLTVNWGNTPPFSVRAYTQMPGSPYCSSDTTTQNITVFLNPAPPVLNGLNNACANSTNNYFTSTVYPSGVAYDWTLSPANAGAILSGQGSNTIQVEWGNNAPQTVILTLTVTICGLSVSDTLQVHLKNAPNPGIVQIGNLCPGVTAQLSATGGPYAAFQWSGPGGFSSTSDPVTITLDGLYQLTVTDAGGCTGITQLNVQYAGVPTASISSMNVLTYCLGTPFTVNLCALGNPNYTYAWSNGANTQCNTVNSPGNYLVTVTDNSTGCQSVSNMLSVQVVNCLPDTGQPCLPGGSVSFTHSSCNPKVFTNTSVNAGSFSWNFGDLTGSALVNPVHLYTQAGFYIVYLSGFVPNTAGTDSCLLTDTALIEIPLLAKFTFSQGCFGDPVCFTDNSVFTAGNNITSWNWNFGDGNFSTLQNPCYTYPLPGTYVVTLTISNPNCTTSVTDTILISPKPTANFTFSNPNCINTPVSYMDSSYTNINYWNWDFGNGGTSLNQNPSQTYMLPGNYPVTLIVHDIFGCYDTITKNITIVAPTISGNIAAFPDTVVCAGTPVLLVAPACGSCTYLWGNGSNNDSITVTTTGIYTVSITDTNGCVFTTFIKIIVNQPPYAVITASKNNLCLGDFANLSVPYNPNWLYNWISNDPAANGFQYTSQSIFPVNTGTYSYQVVITDTVTGCSDTTLAFILQVHQPPVPPVISSIGPIIVCQGDTVTLTVTHPDPSVTFKWSTGEINDTILVTDNGCYTVIATDTNGCTSQAVFCVTVNKLPDLCSFYEGCFDTCAPYIIKGPAGGTSYQWLLNGNPISPNGNSQNYVATTGGQYSLVVTNSFGCTDTTGVLNLSLTLCPDSVYCTSLIVDSIYCDEETGTYTFQYHIINHTQYSLNEVVLQILPPNLSLAYAPSLSFINLPSGDTSAVLSTTVYNGIAGSNLCFRTYVFAYDSLGEELLCCLSDTVCVTLPECEQDTSCCYFNYLSDSVWCGTAAEGQHIYHFSIKVEGCGELDIFTPNTGFISLNNPYLLTGGTSVISGSYISPTDTVLCLTLLLNNYSCFCADTTICFYLPDCTPPVDPCESLLANFSYTTSGLNANFTSTSTVGPGVFISNWFWDFGDPGSGVNNTSNLPNPSHTFTAPGSYTVCLIITAKTVTGEYCYDTICKEIFVEGPVTGPCDNLASLYTYTVNGLNGNFTDASTATGGMVIIAWSWNFGDPGSGAANVSALQHPGHVFTGPGVYNVCLVVIGIIPGTTIICAQQYCQLVHIEEIITDPCDSINAAFSFTFSGPTVNFTDLSTLPLGVTITGWSWNFGDPASGVNNTSTLQNPGHTYTYAGYSLVCLIIQTTNPIDIPCSDTICMEIFHEGVTVDPCDSLIAYFSFTTNGLTGIFTNQSAIGGGIVFSSLSWDFGDPASGTNNTSTLPNPTHTFTASGWYVVCLILEGYVPGTSIKCSDTICKDVFVEGGTLNPCDNLNASFTVSSNGWNFSFTDQSTATGGLVITGWSWNFGHPGSGANNFSSLQNPSHSYTVNGYYLVCLVVTAITPDGLDCSATLCMEILVNVPVVSTGPDIDILTGTSVTLSGSVTGGTPPYVYAWLPAESLSDPTIPNPVASPQVTTVYTLNVTDANGNSGSDDVIVTVLPAGGNISGTVLYDNLSSSPMNNVIVSLFSGPVLIQSTVTNAEGYYFFSNIEPGDYHILCSGSDLWGGVNAADALLILKHFVGQTILTGVRLTAADLDASSYINSADALHAMKRFVGSETSFSSGDWAFEHPAFTVTSDSDLTINILALCFGDVNGTYTPNEGKLEPSLFLENDGIQLIDYQHTIEIPLRIKESLKYAALSLILTYPEKDIVIEDVQSAYDKENLVFRAADGELRIAWNTLNPQLVQEDEVILLIKARLINASNAPLSQLKFTLNGMSSIADYNGDPILNKTLTIPVLMNDKSGFSLNQNNPNPFTGMTRLSYTLPEAGDIKIVLYDLRGKQLRTLQEGYFNAGYHTLDINVWDLESGVYFYRMYYKNNEQQTEQTRRMMISR